MRKFKVLETNLDSVDYTHFTSNTIVGSVTSIPNEADIFKCFMFDGLRIKLIQGDKYILGELHG